MGNKHGCHFIPCVKQRHRRKDQPETATNPAMIPTPPIHEGESISLQHIQERDSEDLDPTIHPELPTMFIAKSELEEAHRQKRSNHHVEQRDHPHPIMRRRCSCSTIFVDDSTISQPNLRSTIKCVSLAVYYHIKNRITSREMDIFDEREHPLTKTPVPADYHLHNPEHRHIYKFIRMLFNAAQLTSECAIVTLVYLERLLINAEIDILPGNWKRIVLGAILLSSKVWDDQAVWNVDYCQILRDLTVEDMNEMERQFLQVLDFNINVPSSVYAKYYFDLRILSDAYELSLPSEPLYKQRAKKLEAFSKESEARLNCAINTKSLRRVQSDTIVSMLPRFDAAILS